MVQKNKRGAKPGNKNAIGNKGGAAPSKYKTGYDQQVYELCLLGFTDKQIADFFDISVSTLKTWKKEHLSFLASLSRGKIIADGQVAASLFKRANGYTYTETTFEALVSDKQTSIEKGKFKKKVVVKELTPDVGAATMWIKNRQKDLWRDKYEIDYDRLSDSQLDYIVDNLLKKQGQNEPDRST